MKKLLANFILLTIAIAIGVGLFMMKQRVVEYEKELEDLTENILENKREIHTLKADWAVLTEPSRLRKLLAESKVAQITVNQVVQAEEVALTPLAVPPAKPFAEPEPEPEPAPTTPATPKSEESVSNEEGENEA